MTLSAILALTIALLLLAILPGPGILLVVSRTLSNGLRAGITTSLGIVAGDYIFIALAIAGLSALAQSFSGIFTTVKYLGAMYLLYLGLILILKPTTTKEQKANTALGHSANFIAGLITTMSNPKAILFYVSFFPAFIDLTELTTIDLMLIYCITTITIGGVMILYAALSLKGISLLQGNGISSRVVRYFSGTVLMGCGIYIGVRP